MSKFYEKGVRFERDLVTRFWDNGWAAVRAAGSGTVSFPVPDVLAVKGGRVILVECKVTKEDKMNFKKAVLSLKKFGLIANAKAYLAVKFLRKEPCFFDIDDMIIDEKYTVSASDPCLSFEALIGQQKTL